MNINHHAGSALHLLLRKTGQQLTYQQRALELLAGRSFMSHEASGNLCPPAMASTEEGHVHVVILQQLEDLKE